MKADININDACKDATMQVTLHGLRSFRCRLFIVMALLRLVAWIAPFNVEVNEI
jgi:hypothetical protein